jgi:transposase
MLKASRAPASVKSTCVPGVHGFDMGKKVNGRKRHVLCHVLSDTQGLPLEVVVIPAYVSDSQGGRLVWKRLGRRRGPAKKLRRVWVDANYKKGVQQWCLERRGVVLEVVQAQSGQQGLAVQPRRWVAERTFGWLSGQRRLARDYEALPSLSESMIWIASARLVLRRLA